MLHDYERTNLILIHEWATNGPFDFAEAPAMRADIFALSTFRFSAFLQLEVTF